VGPRRGRRRGRGDCRYTQINTNHHDSGDMIHGVLLSLVAEGCVHDEASSVYGTFGNVRMREIPSLRRPCHRFLLVRHDFNRQLLAQDRVVFFNGDK
jgi:hypothetical protein